VYLASVLLLGDENNPDPKPVPKQQCGTAVIWSLYNESTALLHWVSMSKIFIVDDHPVSLLAVRVLAEGQGHEIIGTSDNGRDAITALRSSPAELAVIDIDIPPPNGLEVIQRIRQEGFTGGVLVLSAHSERHFIDRARSAGANGYISKNHHLDQLTDAFKAIINGFEYFPLRLQQNSPPPDILPENELLSLLSNRELQVLGFIARGELLVNIAEKLHVSNKSVSTYKRRIMAKLGFSKTLDMIEFAKRNNLA
jgi:two-component system response regulator EvgA